MYYCWLETVCHLFERITIIAHSHLNSVTFSYVRDQSGRVQLVRTCFSRTLSDTSSRTLCQEVSELLVWRLDKHCFLPQIWSQITVRIRNGMVSRHCYKTQHCCIKNCLSKVRCTTLITYTKLIIQVSWFINKYKLTSRVPILFPWPPRIIFHDRATSHNSASFYTAT